MTDRLPKTLAFDTSRLQLELSQKFLSNSTFDSLYKSSNMSPFIENSSEMMLRRLKHHRHPLSGISSLLPELGSNNEFDSDKLFKEVKSNHKLNSRILETWLNNTIEEATDLNLPDKVLKADVKVPLVRFGIDRTTLLNSGLQSSEVDRIYRALFVYSIGFFQLIRKILEHTRKKYSIVTGIWKVFAILLEYCCQFDYEMIIKTLNLEKKEEMNSLENEYKEQILKMEEHERQIVNNFNQTKVHVTELQKDLMDEIRKREELEDELLQRGSGHEEEVTMRLQFESKLNHMFAKLRDMESKLLLVNESLEEIQKLLDDRTWSLQEERKKNLTLVQFKLETEQEIKRVDEKSKQIESVNICLEQRLIDCYSKIEELSQGVSNLNTQNNQALNDLAHRNIEIEDLRFTIETLKGQISKQLNVIIELNTEKNVHIRRIEDLELTLSNEIEKNKHFQQEYVKIKEHDIVKTVDLEKYKKKAEVQEILLLNIEKERDTLKIHKDAFEATNIEYKTQLKQGQEKLEEMNKGRRIVEEANLTLKNRIADREKEIQICRGQIFDLKSQQEKSKTHESELQGLISTLSSKLSSVEKQFEVTRSTLQDKVNSLNEILESEKSVRQNWIYRYEEEQKSSSSITRELLSTQDKLNENCIKFNNLNAAYQETQLEIEKLNEKFKQEIEENHTLRAHNEDLARKLRTSQILLEKVDEDYKERFSEHNQYIVSVNESKMEAVNSAQMETEDMLQRALLNLEIMQKAQSENERLTGIQSKVDEVIAEIRAEERLKGEMVDRLNMLLEDSRNSLISDDIVMATLRNNVKALEFELKKVQKNIADFRIMIPPDLRNSPNPFRVLMKQISDLKGEIQFAEASKAIMEDFSAQFSEPCPILMESEVQTDVFYIESEENENLDAHYRSNSSLYAQDMQVGKKKVDGGIELGLKILEKKKRTPKDHVHELFEKPKKVVKDNMPHEDLVTPLNMRSIYNNEPTNDTAETPVMASGKLPLISKRASQPNSLVTLPQPIPVVGEFKRFLKQAVSRRRNEKNSN